MAGKDDIDSLKQLVAQQAALIEKQGQQVEGLKLQIAHLGTSDHERNLAAHHAKRKEHIEKQLAIRDATAKTADGKFAYYRVPFGTYDDGVMHERGAIIRLAIEKVPGSTFEPVKRGSSKEEFVTVGPETPVPATPAGVTVVEAARPSDVSVLS